ncbi:energy transducer TonB [candidate division KSB1 bacterium]|nr:energy transducer TonB [candidate division KSB1 bacterium]RQW08252.1 MAG: energy transducer TonB [candidate division KSB1 bacterium]
MNRILENPLSNKNRHSLNIKIKDAHGVFERTLAAREKLTLGLSPENDVIVYDSDYPKSHALIENRGSACLLYIHPKMKGAIRYQDSTLAFQDLITQNLLPHKGDFYILQFSSGRKGVIDIGETRVGFLFDGAPASDVGLPVYTWHAAIRKAVAKDLVFKFLLLAFVALEVMWGFHLKNIELPPQEPPAIENVPQRFARFVLRQESAAPITQGRSADGAASGTSDSETDEGSRRSGSEERSGGKEKSVSSAGLLGLIGGAGPSDNTSAAVDFLLDQGLVKELDDLLGSQTVLKNGRIGRSSSGAGAGSGSGEGLDDLLEFGLSGGIDDLISDDAGVKQVNLEKKGNVNIEPPKAMRGSEAARGQRSAESVMGIIRAQHGRVMYTYNKHLRQDPTLRGKVSLDVTIAADGRVADVQVVESTTQNADFIRDLLTIIRQLRFPAISEGSVTVNIPFVFDRVG